MVGTRVRLSRNYQWLRHAVPIQVLSQRPDHPLLAAPPKASGKSPPTVYPMGVCAAMAHSAGLPCHVTATQLYQPPGQILVNRRGTSTLGSLVKSSTSPVQQQALQTMRITDLTGIPCCVLTVMGVSTASPGSRMVLKFDFPTPRMQQQSSSKWTPCYQVSASLEGEELALYASLDGTQKRAQAYQFDTAHELVDPECTERVCLSLQVPLDAPTTVSTDMVRISVKCIIDITVASGNNNNTKKKNNAPTYSNLRLELPVRMVAPMTEYEIILSGEDEEQDEDDAYLKLPLDELILGRSYRTGAVDFDLDDDSPPLIATDALRQTSSPSHPSSFATKGIQQDLTILSLRMAEDCQLIARE
eukprot:Sro859_g212020.1 n/a (359) ;mRNA; r:29773-30849